MVIVTFSIEIGDNPMSTKTPVSRGFLASAAYLPSSLRRHGKIHGTGDHHDGMTYRAGIIGSGGVAGMGLYNGSADDIGVDPEHASHAGGYSGVDDIELVAVADINEDALSRFGLAWDIPTDRQYLSHETMLEAHDLDIVSVCTPSMLHHQHVEDAATIGNPEVIWCEKPIACSISDGEAMIETCDSEGVHLQVNHSQRFRRQHQELKAEIDGGLIGDIHSISSGSPMELLRVGTHSVDLIHYLLGKRIKLVAGYITGESQAGEHLTDKNLDDSGGGGYFIFEDGTFVTFDGTAKREVSSIHHRINGTKGRLVYAEDGWRYWNDDEEVEPPIGGYEDDLEQSFSNAATHALELIETDRDNVSSGSDALHTLEVLVGFYVSHYTDGRVSVPLKRPLRDVTITSW